jgi:hypothetical protein
MKMAKLATYAFVVYIIYVKKWYQTGDTMLVRGSAIGMSALLHSTMRA